MGIRNTQSTVPTVSVPDLKVGAKMTFTVMAIALDGRKSKASGPSTPVTILPSAAAAGRMKAEREEKAAVQKEKTEKRKKRKAAGIKARKAKEAKNKKAAAARKQKEKQKRAKEGLN